MSYLGQKIKDILPGNVAIGGANMGMVPLFSVQWCPSRSSIWAGYAPLDGQELSHNLFPDALAGISAGNVPTTSNANWLATPSARGAYVEVSSPGNFRVPDMNGKSVGSLGAVFLRGDGALSAEIAGVIQQDAMRSHDHLTYSTDRYSSPASLGSSGAIAPHSVGATTGLRTGATGGDETRPLNVTGCWVVKLFGAVTNIGSADVGQLATDYASAMARIGVLEAQPGLGWNQTWQDVLVSRVIGTTYTNTTGRPIEISVVTGALSGGFNLLVNGVVVGSNENTASNRNTTSMHATVPVAGTYVLQRTIGTASTLIGWIELR